MEFKESALMCLSRNMGLKSGESVLILTDDTRKNIGTVLYEAAEELQANAMLMCMQPAEVSGTEPPAAVSAAKKTADNVICATKESISHTYARVEAVKAGARIAMMGGITEEMFCEGAITADYRKVKDLTIKLCKELDEAKTAEIRKEGYSLTLDLTGRKSVPSTGVYEEPGTAGNLPSGEAYIAPLESKTEGCMIIDASMVGVGLLQEPLIVEIQNGRLQKITGADAKILDILFKRPENGVVCELGIGTNDAAILRGIILEDEKIYGTIHIAFGSNISFGGINKADCHMDGVILKPDLYLDGRLVMEKGVYLG